MQKVKLCLSIKRGKRDSQESHYHVNIQRVQISHSVYSQYTHRDTHLSCNTTQELLYLLKAWATINLLRSIWLPPPTPSSNVRYDDLQLRDFGLMTSLFCLSLVCATFPPSGQTRNCNWILINSWSFSCLCVTQSILSLPSGSHQPMIARGGYMRSPSWTRCSKVEPPRERKHHSDSDTPDPLMKLERPK